MTTNHPVPTPPPSEPAPSLRPVEELQALCDAATPPSSGGSSWVVEPHCGAFEVYSGPLSEDSGDIACGIYREADAAFIAAARTALPSLLARLRAAEETLAAVGALAEEWRDYQPSGFYPKASAHADAVQHCGDVLTDLLNDRAALAEGASR